MKALILNEYEDATWEIQLFDNSIIHIEKPKQKLILEIADMQKKIMDIETHPEKYTTQQQFDLLNNLMVRILNNNIEKVVFTKDFISDEWSIEKMQYFIYKYMEFVQEINSDPNL